MLVEAFLKNGDNLLRTVTGNGLHPRHIYDRHGVSGYDCGDCFELRWPQGFFTLGHCSIGFDVVWTINLAAFVAAFVSPAWSSNGTTNMSCIECVA